MSSISSIGSYQGSAAVWLQQVRARASASTPASSDASALSAAASPITRDSGDLKSQIQTAVSEALDKAEDSGQTSDLLAVILQAVQGVLQDNGVDVGSLTQTPRGAGGSPAAGQDPLGGALQAMGLEGEELDSVLNQVHDAVDAAVAKAEETDGTLAMRDVIRSAVDSTLQSNGIDPQQVRANMRPPGGPPPGGGPGPMGGPPPASSSDDSTDSDSTDSSTQSLADLLKEILAKVLDEDGTGSSLSLFLDTEA